MISLDASVRNETAASTSTFRPRRGRPDGEVESIGTRASYLVRGSSAPVARG